MNLSIQEFGQPSNPTILFLHGMGVSSWMWVEQIEALQGRYHCLAVDLPGSGESYQAEWRSFAETAAQLAEIIGSRATNGQAHVVGLSLGGYTALRLLADWPDRVLSTIVTGVTGRPFPSQWLYRPLLHFMSRANRWEPTIQLMAGMMQLPAEARPLFRRDSQRLTPQTSRRIYNELLDFTLPASLAGSSRPLLVVAGEKEARMVREGLVDFEGLPGVVTAVVPNAHHGWNGEFPELFTEMIASWVEGRALPEELDGEKGNN